MTSSFHLLMQSVSLFYQEIDSFFRFFSRVGPLE